MGKELNVNVVERLYGKITQNLMLVLSTKGQSNAFEKYDTRIIRDNKRNTNVSCHKLDEALSFADLGTF